MRQNVVVEERLLPIKSEMQAVCELLGFDPLYLANEGKVVAFVEKEPWEKVLTIMHRHSVSAAARVIGEVTGKAPGQVVLITMIGGLRLLDMLTGEQLPRIC